MLDRHPAVRHVFLASGSCLPLRPVRTLVDYLDARPQTDFIESVTTADVGWTVGGLDDERFNLRFPFSLATPAAAFRCLCRMQRRVGFRRRIPKGIVPHLGSQWWCLTRQHAEIDPAKIPTARCTTRYFVASGSRMKAISRPWYGSIPPRSKAAR